MKKTHVKKERPRSGKNNIHTEEEPNSPNTGNNILHQKDYDSKKNHRLSFITKKRKNLKIQVEKVE